MPRKSLRAIAAASMMFATATAATAQDGVSDNIYVDVVTHENGAPMVVYVFSDGAAGGYAPVDALAIAIDGEGVCIADFDASWDNVTPEEAIYGPGSPRMFGDNKDTKTIEIEKLPSYFAREAAAKMLSKGVVENEKQTVPYFNCAGKVWASVLSQSELPSN
ncbi:MAG: hypothetical protein KTR21_13640 [Rhodobacteraceae bacterium]|nr:hypothetical protein [Paracoccaceae bacterium]